MSVGAGTIGDLYPRLERGTAMGWYYLGLLLGPALAPTIAGIMAQYVHSSGYATGWRSVQWLNVGLGFVGTLLVGFALPETSHGKKIEVIREERRKAREAEGRTGRGGFAERWVVWFNPVGSIVLLFRPNILLASLYTGFTMMSAYSVLVPLSQTIAPRYNINNLGILGCFYLAQGNFSAAQFTGRYADFALRRWLKKRNGVYVPEDRLRATIEGGAFLFPGSIVALGWAMEKSSGAGGLAACAILLFLNGFSLMMILTPTNTYCVDVMQERSAEVIAANNCLRYLLAAGASAFVLPMIDKIGVGWTNTWSAGMVWLGFVMACLNMRYGEALRAWYQPVGTPEPSNGAAVGEEEKMERDDA
ncbi:hypothetical protein MNV49_003407 [Pseudohyphozyma bogoriensis]|nr:hypothetical protein MNV49_003407 [Pseudohyphozyma bogoriensis]